MVSSVERSRAYRKTPKGVAVRIYHHQKQSSKARGHPEPDYTRKEFEGWLLSQPNFQELFDAWVASGYCKSKCLSADRLNDNEPYSFANIRLTDWETNNVKGRSKYRTNHKVGKRVDQFTKDGRFVQTFNSCSAAAHEMGCSIGEITRVCIGGRKSCRNYVWRYTDG